MLLLETTIYHFYLKMNASHVHKNACKTFMWYKVVDPNVPERHIKGGKPIRNI